MRVICLEETAFYALIEQVVARLRDQQGEEKEKWIPDVEAMDLLSIKSKTTLQKLRDEGRIRFTQPQKRIILYDRESITACLERNAHNEVVYSGFVNHLPYFKPAAHGSHSD